MCMNVKKYACKHKKAMLYIQFVISNLHLRYLFDMIFFILFVVLTCLSKGNLQLFKYIEKPAVSNINPFIVLWVFSQIIVNK